MKLISCFCFFYYYYYNTKLRTIFEQTRLNPFKLNFLSKIKDILYTYSTKIFILILFFLILKLNDLRVAQRVRHESVALMFKFGTGSNLDQKIIYRPGDIDVNIKTDVYWPPVRLRVELKKNFHI